MAKKVNYYSWIHELNQSAMRAKYMSEAELFKNSMNNMQLSQGYRTNANSFIDMARVKNQSEIARRHNLNEETAKRITSQQRRDMLAQQMQQRPPQRVAGRSRFDNFPIYDEQGRELENMTFGRADAAMEAGMRELSARGVPGFEAASSASIARAGGNVGEFEALRRAKALGQISPNNLMPPDLDGDGFGSPEEVVADASDFAMDGRGGGPFYAFARQPGIPQQMQHPAPAFDTPEAANAAVRAFNAGETSPEDMAMRRMLSQMDADARRSSRQGTMGDLTRIARILGS